MRATGVSRNLRVNNAGRWCGCSRGTGAGGIVTQLQGVPPFAAPGFPPSFSAGLSSLDHPPDLRDKLQPTLDFPYTFRLLRIVAIFAKSNGDIGNVLLYQLRACVPNSVEWCYVDLKGLKCSIGVLDYPQGLCMIIHESFTPREQWNEGVFVEALLAELYLYSVCGHTHSVTLTWYTRSFRRVLTWESSSLELRTPCTKSRLSLRSS